MSVHVLGEDDGGRVYIIGESGPPCKQINRQTDMTKNITLAQTTNVGGKSDLERPPVSCAICFI